jgi:hypothetical protein
MAMRITDGQTAAIAPTLRCASAASAFRQPPEGFEIDRIRLPLGHYSRQASLAARVLRPERNTRPQRADGGSRKPESHSWIRRPAAGMSLLMWGVVYQRYNAVFPSFYPELFPTRTRVSAMGDPAQYWHDHIRAAPGALRCRGPAGINKHSAQGRGDHLRDNDRLCGCCLERS